MMSVKHNLRISTSVNRNVGGKTVLKQAMEIKGLIGKRQAKQLGVENAAALNKALKKMHKQLFDVNDPNAAKAMRAPVMAVLTQCKQAQARAISAIMGRGKNKRNYEDLSKAEQKQVDEKRRELKNLNEWGEMFKWNTESGQRLGKAEKHSSLSPRHKVDLHLIGMKLARADDGQSFVNGKRVIPAGTVNIVTTQRIRPDGRKKTKQEGRTIINNAYDTTNALRSMSGIMSRWNRGTLKMNAANSRKFNQLLEIVMTGASRETLNKMREVKQQLGLVNKKGLSPRGRARAEAKLSKLLNSVVAGESGNTATKIIRTSKPKSAKGGSKTAIKLGKIASDDSSESSPAVSPENLAPEKAQQGTDKAKSQKEVAKAEPQAIQEPAQSTKTEKPLTKTQKRQIAKEEIKSGMTKVSAKDIEAKIQAAQRDVIEDWTKNTEAKLKEVFKDREAAEQFLARREVLGKAQQPKTADVGGKPSKTEVTKDGNITTIKTTSAEKPRGNEAAMSKRETISRQLQLSHADAHRAFKNFSNPEKLQARVDRVVAKMASLKEQFEKGELSQENYKRYTEDQHGVIERMSLSLGGKRSWTDGVRLVDPKTFKLNPKAVEMARRKSEKAAVHYFNRMMQEGISPKLDTVDSTGKDIATAGDKERAAEASQAFIPRAVLNSMYTDIVTLGSGMGRSIKGGKDKANKKQTANTMALLGRVIAGHINKIAKLKVGDTDGFQKLKNSALDGRVKDFYEAVERVHTTINSPKFNVPAPAPKEKKNTTKAPKAPKAPKTPKTETGKQTTKKKAPVKQ